VIIVYNLYNKIIKKIFLYDNLELFILQEIYHISEF